MWAAMETLGFDVASAGEDEYGQVLKGYIVLDRPTDLEAVRAAHSIIEQHEVGRVGLDCANRGSRRLPR